MEIGVSATDRAGNQSARQLTVMLRWMNESGGQVQAPDPVLELHVPDEVSGPGRLALLYAMSGSERPPGSGGGPVFQVDLLRSRDLVAPVSLNFLTPGTADSGVLRWDPVAEVWEELPTLIDPETGWLSVAVTRLGAFRIGPVDAANRRLLDDMQYYPNPYLAESVGVVRILYRVAVAGPTRLRIFNSAGQPVRALVDQSKAAGTWSAVWDGTDDSGRAVGSGVYFLDLVAPSGRRQGTITLLR